MNPNSTVWEPAFGVPILRDFDGNSTFLDDTSSMPNNVTNEFDAVQVGAKSFIYKGPAPPSYWDSPISASQLIVTCILLVVLCGIYTYSNFDKDDTTAGSMLKPNRNGDASELVPLQGGGESEDQAQSAPANEDNVVEKALLPVTLVDIENQVLQRENNQLSEDWHGEILVTREKLERIMQWLNSCPNPSTIYTFKQCQVNEV